MPIVAEEIVEQRNRETEKQREIWKLIFFLVKERGKKKLEQMVKGNQKKPSEQENLQTGKHLNFPPQNSEELEQKFSSLSDIMERVSSINGTPSGDLQLAIEELEAFAESLIRWDFNRMPDSLLGTCINHLFYHREILNNLISETRQTIEEERRYLFRQIVAHGKKYSQWLSSIEGALRDRLPIPVDLD